MSNPPQECQRQVMKVARTQERDPRFEALARAEHPIQAALKSIKAVPSAREPQTRPPMAHLEDLRFKRPQHAILSDYAPVQIDDTNAHRTLRRPRQNGSK